MGWIKRILVGLNPNAPMIKQDIYNVHFEKYLELKRDCDSFIREGKEGTGRCFDKIRDYLDDFGLENDADPVTQLESSFSELTKDILRGIIENRDAETKRLRVLNNSIQALINSYKPNGVSDYGKNSLRKNSGWDERDNLSTFILFFSDNEIDHVFRKLLKNKIFTEKIKIERFYVQNGEKTIIPNDFDPYALNEIVDLDPEENEIKKSSDFINIDGEKVPIESRSLSNENAIRYEHRDVDGFLIAEAIVEKKVRKSQIWVSTNGEARCEFLNEIVAWFQGAIDQEDCAICIPQAIEFVASKSSESEISLQLKQPI
mgnify:CR=1 FL=1